MESLTFKTEFAALPFNIQNLLRTVKANKNSKVELRVESEVASLTGSYRTESVNSIKPIATQNASSMGDDGEWNSRTEMLVSRSAIAMRYSRSRSNAPKTFMVAVALPARTFAELEKIATFNNGLAVLPANEKAILMDAIEELG